MPQCCFDPCKGDRFLCSSDQEFLAKNFKELRSEAKRNGGKMIWGKRMEDKHYWFYASLKFKCYFSYFFYSNPF